MLRPEAVHIHSAFRHADDPLWLLRRVSYMECDRVRTYRQISKIPFRVFDQKRPFRRRAIAGMNDEHDTPHDQGNNGAEAQMYGRTQHSFLRLIYRSQSPASRQIVESKRQSTTNASGEENPNVQRDGFLHRFHSGWFGQAKGG